MKHVIYISLITTLFSTSTSIYACQNHGGSYRGFFAGYNDWSQHDIPDENAVNVTPDQSYSSNQLDQPATDTISASKDIELNSIKESSEVQPNFLDNTYN